MNELFEIKELFETNEKGQACFSKGKDAFKEAQMAAEECLQFAFDVEEELFTEEEERSCYNCRYRRWTKASFTCQGRE